MNYSEAQLEIINTIDGNIGVIASAGSGKTTVLTKRIENMVKNHSIAPQDILAVTFSKKAKENIQDKLKELDVNGVNIETFHSLALKIIGTRYGVGYFKVWTLQWEKEKIMQTICCDRMNLCSKDDVPYNDILRFIGKQKNAMLSAMDELIYSDDDPFSKNNMKEIFISYEKFKEENRYIEFDDFLNLANEALDTDKDTYDYYSNCFKYVLSDEFQDISKSQSLLLKKLNTKNTMIVGDPLQAIYSFRGGNSKYILDFEKDYPNAKIAHLNKNYRCSEDIIKTANVFANTIPDSKHKNYRESIANNKAFKKPEFAIYKDEWEEADKIADKINLLVREYKYKDIAILARTNAQLTKIQSTFHEKLIPFSIVNGSLFTDLPEIKLLISYLKLALYENDNESFRYLYNKPNRWLDRKFLQEVENNSKRKNVSFYSSMMSIDRRNWRFKNGIDEIYEVINYLQNKRFSSIGDMISYLRIRLNIDEFVTKGKQADDGSYVEQIENMNAFENIAKKYTDLEKFIMYLDDITKDLQADNENKVQLLTIHKSKGLEYPVVFIIGCSDGLLPHNKSKDLNDEKKLFYVGITRAEKELYISSILSNNATEMKISPFVYAIKETIKPDKSVM
jgi:DNA helicase-2/ATP-dependent DNA helicase PcrA|nr:MAG TPA: REP HELICASE [Caudoviricetes sp.]